MEKKKISNFMLLFSTLIVIVVLIITKTVFVLNERHEQKLIYAMHSKVEYSAKRCFLEEKCQGVVTLQMLYDNEYLTDEVVDPITKEVISHNLEIKYEEDKVVIHW